MLEAPFFPILRRQIYAEFPVEHFVFFTAVAPLLKRRGVDPLIFCPPAQKLNA